MCVLSEFLEVKLFPLPAELRHRAVVAQRLRVRPPAAGRCGEKGGGAIAHQLHGSSTHPGENRTGVGHKPLSGLPVVTAWACLQGVVEFSLCLLFAKLVSYTFLFWLPLYITKAG